MERPRFFDSILNLRPEISEWNGELFSLIHEKKDGHRVTICREPDSIHAYSKKKYIDLWPMLRNNEALVESVIQLPPWTVLDGELAGDCPASDVISKMKAADQNLKFFPFAMPISSGFTCFRANIHENDLYFRELGFDTPIIVDARRLAEPYGIKPFELTREMLLEEIESFGWEGFVLKVGHYTGWYKLKLLHTLDAMVTGWIEGKTRGVPNGKMGSLSVSLWDAINKGWVEVADVGIGWTKEQRAELSPEVTQGRILEVEYDKLEANGRLRFPRFEGWRDDKPVVPASCSLDQLVP